MPARPHNRPIPDVPAPEPFNSPDGRFHGWTVRIHGRKPLATPAVLDGLVFLGGGFGSYEFHALDALTGRAAWIYPTADDGPTAAVVADGLVAFNTESCELEVLTTAGQPVWKRWLGDPLMSMPAVDAGRVFMVYPDSRGDRRHHLAAFDLHSGEPLWKQPIPGEIISAPVVAEGAIHATCLDGTLVCLRADSGEPLWQQPAQATSAPTVRDGRCYYSQRLQTAEGAPSADGPDPFEHLAARSSGPDPDERAYGSTVRRADYLHHARRLRGSVRHAASRGHDAAVGFAHFKGDAKLHMAEHNLGQSQVHEVWSFQGSRPFLAHGRLYASQGDSVVAIDPDTDQAHWRRRLSLQPETAEVLDAVLTPPAIAGRRLFVGSLEGRLHCLDADSGAEHWSVRIGEPIAFPPAIWNGRVYLGTDSGTLVCIDTGDSLSDGWPMWGATAAHNGVAD